MLTPFDLKVIEIAQQCRVPSHRQQDVPEGLQVEQDGEGQPRNVRLPRGADQQEQSGFAVAGRRGQDGVVRRETRYVRLTI